MDSIKQVFISRARFSRGVGWAGEAWDKIGTSEALILGVLPDFKGNRALMKKTYMSMNIPEEIVDKLSDYMVDVKAIICYAFHGNVKKNLLAVLSVDLKEPNLTVDPNEPGIGSLDMNVNKLIDTFDLLASYLNRAFISGR